ncbi:MAG: hypothetical protein SWK90_11345 [Chloroflexota bacterium]|nr:hypothetical protein [Chloroflexota bacterium]
MVTERVSQTLGQFNQREILARYISHITNPVFIAIPLALGVAWQDAPSWAEALRWGGLFLLLTDLGPMALLVVLARRGRVTSLKHARRRDRIKPLLISLACLSVTVTLYQWLDAPPLLCRLAWLQFVQAALMTVITPAWQISFHGAAAGALVTTSLLLYGTSTWPLLGLLPLVGWSQVEGGRHTAAQMAAGMLLAILLYGLGFSM